jgi:hypothetical protein
MTDRGRLLHAGRVSALFDAADLRYVRVEGREVLRRVYFALRDRHWGTLANEISGLRIVEEEGGFSVDYDAECRAGDIHFRWTASIRGARDGSIVWTARGEALSTFLKNRVGWCVLHPVDALAGAPCEVEHGDGAVEPGCFPRYVAPHQPFFDIRAIRHEVVPGLSAEVRFHGDVFEIEDQRNWSDATYKIYSTPLSIPFPAAMRAGDCVEQSVILRLSEIVRVEITGDPLPLPEIGYRYSPALTPQSIRSLGPAHIRVDREADLAAASDLGVALECAFTAPAGVPVRRQLVLDSVVPDAPPSTVEEVAIGTNANFAEFNRIRPDASRAAAVCFPINPQVHATDELTLIENLAAQAAVVESARLIAPGKHIAVTPVYLDPPQSPWFAAAWTLGSIKYLAESGVASITYDAPAGPVHDLLEDIAGATHVVPCRSTMPLTVEALALRQAGRTRLFLLNFSAGERRVEIPGALVTLPPSTVRSFDL